MSVIEFRPSLVSKPKQTSGRPRGDAIPQDALAMAIANPGQTVLVGVADRQSLLAWRQKRVNKEKVYGTEFRASVCSYEGQFALFILYTPEPDGD